MRSPEPTGTRFDPQSIGRFLNAIGMVLFIIGFLFGALQTWVHVQIYYAGTRGVTLDRVYAILFFWMLWCVLSTGYLLAGRLVKYEHKTAILAALLFGSIHLGVVGLVATEIGWI